MQPITGSKTFMFSVSDPLTQVLLLVGAGILCVGMATWFRAPRVRPHGSSPVGAASNPARVLLPVAVPSAPHLNIDTVVQHGRIVEIKGAAEPGTVVMINGQPATAIFDGNQFRHFLGPLPKGTTVISITCQNEHGGVTTRHRSKHRIGAASHLLIVPHRGVVHCRRPAPDTWGSSKFHLQAWSRTFYPGRRTGFAAADPESETRKRPIAAALLSGAPG